MAPGPIQPDDIPIDLFPKDADAAGEAYTELDDNHLFSMGAFHGVPWTEAIMGCPVHLSGTNMYSVPCTTDGEDYD
jgi:hypothetical protein